MEQHKSKHTEEVVLREALSGAKKIEPVAEAAGGARKIAQLEPKTSSPMSSNNQPEPKPKPLKK